MGNKRSVSEHKPVVLVLCTGNSCRSQIAEAFLRERSGGRVVAHSAGTEPADRVHPLAVRVMEEIGISLDGQSPKHLEEFLGGQSISTLMTVCDSADRSCPAVWPGAPVRLRWPFEDPAAFRGDEEATIEKFREIRDKIEARIVEWLEDEMGLER